MAGAAAVARWARSPGARSGGGSADVVEYVK